MGRKKLSGDSDRRKGRTRAESKKKYRLTEKGEKVQSCAVKRGFLEK